MTTFYIQRTTVEIIAAEAENADAALEDPGSYAWQASIDTEVEYALLDNAGEHQCSM